jgi:hypothetical protein
MAEIVADAICAQFPKFACHEVFGFSVSVGLAPGFFAMTSPLTLFA